MARRTLGLARACVSGHIRKCKDKTRRWGIHALKKIIYRILRSVHPAQLEKCAVYLEIMTVGPFEFLFTSDYPCEILELG